MWRLSDMTRSSQLRWKSRKNKNKPKKQKDSSNIWLGISMFGKITEKVGKIMNKAGIKTYTKSSGKLINKLNKTVRAKKVENPVGGVYVTPCTQCSAVYVGETCRHRDERTAEHKRAVDNLDHFDGIYIHHKLTNHKINWDATKIVLNEKRLYPRKILESEIIKLKNKNGDNLMNLNSGWGLSNIWTSKVLQDDFT